MKYPIPYTLNPKPFSKGFTLIELLIAGSISSLIFLLVINTLMIGIKNRKNADITASLQKTTTNIINDISQYTRWATSVQTTPNTLAVVTNDQQLVTFYLSGTSLIRNLPNSNNVELNPSDIAVTDFTITPYPPTSPQNISITLKLQHKTSAQFTFSSTSTIAIRTTTIGTP